MMFAPDTQIVITEQDGDYLIWNPTLDEFFYVASYRYANGSTASLDFSPYNELMTAYYDRMLADDGWNEVTAEDLVGTTWYDYGYTKENNYYEYKVTFNEDTADVAWNAGYGETTEYTGAEWTLSDGEIPVLSIDFGEFAGVRRYNLLIDYEDGFLYIAADATGEALTWDSEPQYRFLMLQY
jgi:hypothetical protein